MKQWIILLLAFICSIPLYSQNRQKEIGLEISPSGNFGVLYRFGTDKSMWRLSSFFVHYSPQSWSLDERSDTENKLFGIGFTIGKEYKKKISKKFELRYGIDVSLSTGKNTSKYYTLQIYDYNNLQKFEKTSETKSFSYSIGLTGFVGINYLISNHFILGIIPFRSSIEYLHRIENQQHFSNSGDHGYKEKNTSFQRIYGRITSPPFISIMYRF